jgi:rubredoxin
VYDETVGEPESNIAAGVKFGSLPADYCCPLCDAGKESFTKIEKLKLGLQAV